jgi:hypothetical protein
MNSEEFENWRTQNAASKKDKQGLRIYSFIAQLKQVLIPVEQAERRWIGIRRPNEEQ